jgi:hypothetical protein
MTHLFTHAFLGGISEDGWQCFNSEQDLVDFVSRIPGAPLTIPPRSLSSTESLQIENEAKIIVDKVVEDFRRYKVKMEIALKQKDVDVKKASNIRSSEITSNNSDNSEEYIDELQRLKAQLAAQELKWKTAYEKVTKENELLRSRGSDTMVATQWRERYESCIKDRDELTENLRIFTSSSSNSTVIDINPQSAPSSSSSSSLAVRYSEEGKQIPIGNGGIGPNYYWTQTLQDLTVYVDVPVGCRGRDIKCFIEAKKLFLSADGQVMIDGFFEEAIKVDESMWTLNITANSIPQVVITLDKGRKTWWKHIIQGHPEIDTSKVDSSQKIDEYDDSTQAAIRKIMFDQKQKALGLPTSEDIEKEDLIQKAMSMPGCPFIQTDEVGSPVMPPGISSPWDVEKGKKKG